jgi:hypothetical protein
LRQVLEAHGVKLEDLSEQQRQSSRALKGNATTPGKSRRSRRMKS